MKVLNLYAGIGGNRKLWPKECIVTAVENNPQIAAIYKHYFPNDNIIITDAKKYLLDHYKEFEFIWASPPCQSHSRQRQMCVEIGQSEPIYPDLSLYEIIIFLHGFYKGKWIVENVVGYYEPLIKAKKIQRHYFWSNFNIQHINLESDNIQSGNIGFWSKKLGFNISQFKLDNRKDQIYRNCVDPKLGLHIFNCAFKEKQTELK